MKLKSRNKEAQAYLRNIENLYHIESIRDTSGTVIDLGAHVGVFSMRVTEVTNCVIHAYEPYYRNCRELIHNLRKNDLTRRVTIYNEAIWETFISLNLNLDPERNSSDSHTLCNMENWKSKEVRTVPTSQVFSRVEGVITYLKVNCEGGEYFVLKHLVENRNDLDRVMRMTIEIHPDMIGKQWTNEIVEMLDYLIKETTLKLKIMFAGKFSKNLASEIKERLSVNTLCQTKL